MIDVLKRWYMRNFANPQTVILALILIAGSVVVILSRCRKCWASYADRFLNSVSKS